jgi:PAS domain S-box-containing protein
VNGRFLRRGARSDATSRFAPVFESIAIGVSVADAGARIVDVNSTFASMLGFEREELIGKTIAEITHPDDLRGNLELFDDLWAGRCDSYRLEKRFLRRDGSVVWARINTSLMRSGRGTPEFVLAMVENVDDRKRAEALLREAEERYRSLVEQLPIVTYIDALDDVSSSVYMSPQVEEMLGYAVEEWQSDPEFFVKTLHPEDRDRVLAEVVRTNRSLEPFLQEYRLIHRDGSVVWVRDAAVVIQDASGRPFQSQGYLLDLTDRRLAEDDLRASEARTRSIVEGALDAVVSMDAGGRITGWNANARALFGWTAEEALGRELAETIVPPGLRDAHRRGLARYLETGHTAVVGRRIELTALRRDGTEFPVELAITADSSNGTVAFNAFVRDISARLDQELALRRSEERFRTLIENIPGAVYRCLADEDWTMQFISDEIEAITGHPASDFLGNAIRSYASVIAADDREHMFALVDAAIEKRAPFILEYRIERADGTRRWVYEKGQPVFDDDGSIRWLDGVIFDVTQRKLAEAERDRLLEAEQAARAEAEAAREQLAEQNEALRVADRLKDEFVALVSHELRTPLTSIIGYVDLVSDEEGGPVTSEQRHFLDVIKRNSQRLLRLVGDLLFVAQVESGKLALETGPVDLAGVARDCLEAARPRADEKEIQLGLVAGPLRAFQGDRVRLAQLLDNLVSNAVKFTPRGGRVEVGVAERDGDAVVTVADTGIGIPPAEQERLFERFFRAESATRLAIPGSGLGLTISKAIAEAHGGSISVASEEGRGTTFSVALPLARENEDAARAA